MGSRGRAAVVWRAIMAMVTAVAGVAVAKASRKRLTQVFRELTGGESSKGKGVEINSKVCFPTKCAEESWAELKQ
jgi:hypothetical protein